MEVLWGLTGWFSSFFFFLFPFLFFLTSCLLIYLLAFPPAEIMNSSLQTHILYSVLCLENFFSVLKRHFLQWAAKVGFTVSSWNSGSHKNRKGCKEKEKRNNTELIDLEIQPLANFHGNFINYFHSSIIGGDFCQICFYIMEYFSTPSPVRPRACYCYQLGVI